MLEYTLDEAEELLSGNQKTAQTTLEKVDEDLDFLRYKIKLDLFKDYFILK
jgi:hypothetical protein